MYAKLISSSIRLVLLLCLGFILFAGDHVGVSFDYPYRPLFDNIYVRLAKCCVHLLVLIEVFRLYYYGVVKNPNVSRLAGNLATLFVPVIALFLVLEMAFMFVEQPQGGALTLSSRIWFERHWLPLTTDYYRDSPKTDTFGKKKILVVGDSFTAGQGLKSVDERYGDILSQKLGDQQYVVYNMGIMGSDTRDEYKRLTEFRVKPDVVVLQYFPNDIEKVAMEQGLTPAMVEPLSDLPRMLRPLFIRSYLLNYLYWQLPHSNFVSFDPYVRTAYTTPAIINSHLADLNQFIDYAKQHQVRLYVVLFPILHNLEKTADYTKPVVELFRRNNVPVLEVGKLIADVPFSERVIGRNDGHASSIVNRRVGEALSQMMQPSLVNQHP